LLRHYVGLGLDPGAFWHLSPREISVRIQGAGDRLQREHDQRAWLAWHTAGMPLMKKFPDLKDLQTPKPKKRQTPEEMMAVMRAWSPFFGGENE
jgi:hypothetical protein